LNEQGLFKNPPKMMKEGYTEAEPTEHKSTYEKPNFLDELKSKQKKQHENK